MLTRDEFERMIARIRESAEGHPVLAALLLADVPDDYDPETQLGVPKQVEGVPEITSIVLAAQKIARSRKLEALAEARRLFMREAEKLNRKLLDGSQTPQDILRWQFDIEDLLKEIHTEAYAIGKSGKWSEMGRSDWGRVGSIIRQQRQFLQGWVNIMYRDGVEAFSLAQLNARIRLYANAAQQAFERGIVAELGVNPAVLPAYPGDGTTACKANCRCRWAIRIISKVRGDYDATWRLGVAEHCSTCRRRARVWKRLKVRRGVLVEGFEPVHE